MSDPLLIPVVLVDGHRRFHDPTLERLPAWLEKLAADLDQGELTADLYAQEIHGLRNWAAMLRELLAQARRAPRPQ
jgi:hypothetical protein